MSELDDQRARASRFDAQRNSLRGAAPLGERRPRHPSPSTAPPTPRQESGERTPAAEMVTAAHAPMSGSIPVALGTPAVVRIPIVGLSGLCIELFPRGWRPKSGSTSSLFIQDITGSRHLRLDYGYNVKTGAVDFHWNQKGTFAELGIANHTPVGGAGGAVYTGAKYFRYGGVVLMVVGAGLDIYSVAVASKPLRQATKVGAAWAGAWIGCKVVGGEVAGLGTLIEPGLGTAIGGLVGCAVGAFIGYETASAVAGRVYDWAERTVFTPVPASD